MNLGIFENSGDIDIYVIRGKPEAARPAATPARLSTMKWTDYAGMAAVVTLCGLFGALNYALGWAEANIVMVFLLGVAVVATRFGRGPAIAASIVSVLVFDYFFVPPYFTLTVNDSQYYLAFGVMLAIGLLISTLTARLKEQLSPFQEHERHTAALYRFTKQ